MYYIVHAYVVSTCTDGTVALSHVQLKISADTSIQDIKAERLEVWFEGIPGIATLLEVFDEFVRNPKICCGKSTVIYIILLGARL